MIIDNTFFHSKILIPNIGSGIGKINIEPLIENECYSFLQSLLGNEIYSDLEQYFDTDLSLKTDAPQKYLDLFYGKKYDDKHWKGLIDIKKLGKYSLIADYIWLKWYEDNITLTSTNGQVVLDAKNTMRVNPTDKYVEVWNGLVRKVHGYLGYNKPYVTYKGSIRFTDYYGARNNQNVNLEEFLNDFKEDYPNPTLLLPDGNVLRIKNTLGL